MIDNPKRIGHEQSTSDLVELTTEQLQNNGTIGSSTYSDNSILDALNTTAQSIQNAKTWSCVDGINDGFPYLILENT